MDTEELIKYGEDFINSQLMKSTENKEKYQRDVFGCYLLRD